MFWLSFNEEVSLLERFSNRSELVVMETRRSLRSTESGIGSEGMTDGCYDVEISLGGSIGVGLSFDTGSAFAF